MITPYGEGGVATLRWFDLSAEVMYLTRESGAGSRAFSSLGLAPDSPDDFVLSSDQTDLNSLRPGSRSKEMSWSAPVERRSGLLWFEQVERFGDGYQRSARNFVLVLQRLRHKSFQRF